jgi:hypothetical protein
MDIDQGAFYMLFLFLIYLFVNSEVAFVRIFKNFQGASDDGYTTNTYGTILQGILLVLMYFLIVIFGDYLWEYADEDENTTTTTITPAQPDIKNKQPDKKNKQSWKSWMSFM